MLALVNDVLDIAAIEAGKRDFLKEALNLNELLKDCIKSIEKTAIDDGIQLLSEIPAELPTLFADKRSMVQIVLNILSNAINFTNLNGTITVSVNVKNSEIAISVKDTGIGIPADKLSVITQPFMQASSNPHKAQAGTGLGLSIVKSLAESNGDRLNIDSEVQKGTTVTVTFPLHSA